MFEFKIFGNRMTFKKIIIGILSLRGCTLASSYALCHSFHPLTLIFIQVITFCKIACVSLIEIEVKLTLNLESFMAYWQHLNIA
jgi:hypothetical protein